MPIWEISNFQAGISSFNEKGPKGSGKLFKNLDIRRASDTLTCGQAMLEEGLLGISHSSSQSLSPSASLSPSSSASPSISPSNSPSKSQSPSASASKSVSPSASPSSSASPSGSASASPSASSAVDNVFVDLIKFIVKASDGNAYGFGDRGNIYRRYTDGYWKNVYHDINGEIKGAEEKPSSTGVTYLQWATENKVMQKLIPGNSDWTDVEIVAENLTGADWHTMKMVGGANYIANGSKLALVGYDDSYTNEALDVIPGNYIKSILERNGRAVVGSYKAGYPDKGINAMIDCEVPLAQVGDSGDLVFANFTDVLAAKKFPSGGRVNPGGVTSETDNIQVFAWSQGSDSWSDKQTLSNMSIWGVFDSTDSSYNGLYYYGRRTKDFPFAMTLEYAMDVDEIGAVAVIEGVVIASYRDGNDYGVRAVDPDTKATGDYQSLEFRVPVKSAEVITPWKYSEVLMEALPAGCSVEMFFKVDHSSSWSRAYTVNGQTSYSVTNGKKATFRLGFEGDVAECRLLLNPASNTAPNIIRIRNYFG